MIHDNLLYLSSRSSYPLWLLSPLLVLMSCSAQFALLMCVIGMMIKRVAVVNSDGPRVNRVKTAALTVINPYSFRNITDIARHQMEG